MNGSNIGIAQREIQIASDHIVNAIHIVYAQGRYDLVDRLFELIDEMRDIEKMVKEVA